MLNNSGEASRTLNGHDPSSTQSPMFQSQSMSNIIGSSLHPGISMLPTRSYSTQAQLDEYYNNCIYQSKIFPSQRNLCHNYKRSVPNEYHADKRPYICFNSCCQPYSSSYSMNTATMPTPLRFPFSQINQSSSMGDNPSNAGIQDQLIHSQPGMQQCQQVDVHYLPPQTPSNAVYNQRVNSTMNAQEPPSIGSHYSSSNYLHPAYYGARPNLPVSPEYYKRMPNKNQSTKINPVKHQTSVIKNSNDFSYLNQSNPRPSNMMHLTPMNYMYNKRHSSESLPPDCLPACSQVTYPPNNQYSPVMTPHAHRSTIMETPVFSQPCYSTPMITSSREPDAKLQHSIEPVKKSNSSKPPLNIDVRQFLATWDDNDDEPESVSSAAEGENSACSAVNKSSQPNPNISSNDLESGAKISRGRNEFSNLTAEEENSVLFKILKPSGHKTTPNSDPYNMNLEQCAYNQVSRSKTESPINTKTTSPMPQQSFMKHCPSSADSQCRPDMFVSFYSDKNKCNEPTFDLPEKVLSPHEKINNSSCHYALPLNPVKNLTTSQQTESQNSSYFDLEQNVIKNRKTYSPNARPSKPASKSRSPIPTLDYEFKDPEKYIKPIIINKSDYIGAIKPNNEVIFKHVSKMSDSKQSGKSTAIKERNVSIVPPHIQYSDKTLNPTTPVSFNDNIPSFRHSQIPYNKKTLMPYCISANNQLNNPNYEYPVMSVISSNCNYVKYDCSSPNFISEDPKYDNTCSVNINLNITSDKSPHVFLNSLNTTNPNHISCTKPIDNSSHMHHDVDKASERSACEQNDGTRDKKESRNLHEDRKIESSKPKFSIRNEKSNSLISSPVISSDKETKSPGFSPQIPDTFPIHSMISGNTNTSSIGELKYLRNDSPKSIGFQKTSGVSPSLNLAAQPDACANFNKNINSVQVDGKKSDFNQFYLTSESSPSCPVNSVVNPYCDSRTDNANRNAAERKESINKFRPYEKSNLQNDGSNSDALIQLSIKNDEKGKFSPNSVSSRRSNDQATLNVSAEGNLSSEFTFSVTDKNSDMEIFENRFYPPIISPSQTYKENNAEAASCKKSCPASQSPCSKSNQIDVNSNDINFKKKFESSINFPAPTDYAQKSVHSICAEDSCVSPTNTCQRVDSFNVEETNKVSTNLSNVSNLSASSVITTTCINILNSNVDLDKSSSNYTDSAPEKGKVGSVSDTLHSVAEISSEHGNKDACIPELSRIKGIIDKNDTKEFFESDNQDTIDSIINSKCESFEAINDRMLDSSSCFPMKSHSEAEKREDAEDKILSLSPVMRFSNRNKSVDTSDKKIFNSSKPTLDSLPKLDSKNSPDARTKKKDESADDMASLLDFSSCANTKVAKAPVKVTKIKPKSRSVSNEFSNFDLFNDNGSFFSDVTCSEASPKLHSLKSSSNSTIESSNIGECFNINNSVSNNSQIVCTAKNDDLTSTKTDNHTDFEILVQNEMNKFNFESDILNISSLEVEVETSQFFNEQSMLHSCEKSVKILDVDQSESSSCPEWQEPKDSSNVTSSFVKEKSNPSNSFNTDKMSAEVRVQDQEITNDKLSIKINDTLPKSRAVEITHLDNQKTVESFFVDTDEKTETNSENETVHLSSASTSEDKIQDIVQLNSASCDKNLAKIYSSDLNSSLSSTAAQVVCKTDNRPKFNLKINETNSIDTGHLEMDSLVSEKVSTDRPHLEKIFNDKTSKTKTLSMDDFIQLDFSPKDKSVCELENMIDETSSGTKELSLSDTSLLNVSASLKEGNRLAQLNERNYIETDSRSSVLSLQKQTKNDKLSVLLKKKKHKKNKKRDSDQPKRLPFSRIKFFGSISKSELEFEGRKIEELIFPQKLASNATPENSTADICQTSTTFDNLCKFKKKEINSESVLETMLKDRSEIFPHSPADDKSSSDFNERITHSPIDCFDNSALDSPKFSISKSIATEMETKKGDSLFASASMTESQASPLPVLQRKERSYFGKSKMRKKRLKSFKIKMKKIPQPSFSLEDDNEDDEFLDLISTRICNNLEADDANVLGGSQEALSSQRKLLSRNDPFIFRKEKASPTNASESISLELNKSTVDSDIYPDIDCVDSTSLDSQSDKRIETIPFTSSYDSVPDAVYESLNNVSVETASPVMARVDLISDDSVSDSSDKNEHKLLESVENFGSSKNEASKPRALNSQTSPCPIIVDLTDSDAPTNNRENLPVETSKALPKDNQSDFNCNLEKSKKVQEEMSSMSVAELPSLDSLSTLDQFADNLNSVFLVEETSMDKVTRKEDDIKFTNNSAVDDFSKSLSFEEPLKSSPASKYSEVMNFEDPLEIPEELSSQADSNLLTGSAESLITSKPLDSSCKLDLVKVRKKKKKKKKSKPKGETQFTFLSLVEDFNQHQKEVAKRYDVDKVSSISSTNFTPVQDDRKGILTHTESFNNSYISPSGHSIGNPTKDNGKIQSFKRLKNSEDRKIEVCQNNSNILEDSKVSTNISSDIQTNYNQPSLCPFSPNGAEVIFENQRIPVTQTSSEKTSNLVLPNQKSKQTNEWLLDKQTITSSNSPIDDGTIHKNKQLFHPVVDSVSNSLEKIVVSKDNFRPKPKKTSSFSLYDENSQQNVFHSCINTSKAVNSVQNISSAPDFLNFDADVPYDRQENINFEDFHILFDQTLERFSKLKEQEKEKSNSSDKNIASSLKSSPKAETKSFEKSLISNLQENKMGCSLDKSSQKKFTPHTNSTKLDFESDGNCKKSCKKGSTVSNICDKTDFKSDSTSDKSNLSSINDKNCNDYNSTSETSSDHFSTNNSSNDSSKLKDDSVKSCENQKSISNKVSSLVIESSKSRLTKKNLRSNRDSFSIEANVNKEASKNKRTDKNIGSVVSSSMTEYHGTIFDQNNSNTKNDPLSFEVSFNSEKYSFGEKDHSKELTKIISSINKEPDLELHSKKVLNSENEKLRSELSNSSEQNSYKKKVLKNKSIKLKSEMKSSSEGSSHSSRNNRTKNTEKKNFAEEENDLKNNLQNVQNMNSGKDKTNLETNFPSKKSSNNCKDAISLEFKDSRDKNRPAGSNILKVNDKISAESGVQKNFLSKKYICDSANVNLSERPEESSQSQKYLSNDDDEETGAKNNVENSTSSKKQKHASHKGLSITDIPLESVREDLGKCSQGLKSAYKSCEGTSTVEDADKNNASSPKSASDRPSVVKNCSSTNFQAQKSIHNKPDTEITSVKVGEKNSVCRVFESNNTSVTVDQDLEKSFPVKNNDYSTCKVVVEDTGDKSLISQKLLTDKPSISEDCSMSDSFKNDKVVFAVKDDEKICILKHTMGSSSLVVKNDVELNSSSEQTIIIKNDKAAVEESAEKNVFRKNLGNSMTCTKVKDNTARSSSCIKSGNKCEKEIVFEDLEKISPLKKHESDKTSTGVKDSLGISSQIKKSVSKNNNIMSLVNDGVEQNSISSKVILVKSCNAGKDGMEKSCLTKNNSSYKSIKDTAVKEGVEKHSLTKKHTSEEAVAGSKDTLRQSSHYRKSKHFKKDDSLFESNKMSDRKSRSQNNLNIQKRINFDGNSKSKKNSDHDKTKIKIKDTSERNLESRKYTCRKNDRTNKEIRNDPNKCSIKQKSGANQICRVSVGDKETGERITRSKNNVTLTNDKVSSDVSDNLELLKNVFGTNKTKYKSTNLQGICNVLLGSNRNSQIPADNSIYFAENYKIMDVSKIPLPPTKSRSSVEASVKICTDDLNVVNCKLLLTKDKHVTQASNESHLKVLHETAQYSKKKEDLEDDMPTLSPTKESVIKSPDFKEMPILSREGISSPQSSVILTIDSATTSKVVVKCQDEKKIEHSKSSIDKRKCTNVSNEFRDIEISVKIRKEDGTHSDVHEKSRHKSVSRKNDSSHKKESSKIVLTDLKDEFMVSEAKISDNNKTLENENENINAVFTKSPFLIKTWNQESSKCKEEKEISSDSSDLKFPAEDGKISTEASTCEVEKMREISPPVLSSYFEDQPEISESKSVNKYVIFNAETEEGNKSNISSKPEFENKFESLSLEKNVNTQLTSNKLQLSCETMSGIKVINKDLTSSCETHFDPLISSNAHLPLEKFVNLTEKEVSVASDKNMPVLVAESQCEDSKLKVLSIADTFPNIDAPLVRNKVTDEVVVSDKIVKSNSPNSNSNESDLIDKTFKNNSLSCSTVEHIFIADECDKKSQCKEQTVNGNALVNNQIKTKKSEVNNPPCIFSEVVLSVDDETSSNFTKSSELSVSVSNSNNKLQSADLKSTEGIRENEEMEEVIYKQETSVSKTERIADLFNLTIEEPNKPIVSLEIIDKSNIEVDSLNMSHSKTNSNKGCKSKLINQGVKRTLVADVRNKSICKRQKRTSSLTFLEESSIKMKEKCSSVDINKNKMNNSKLLSENNHALALNNEALNSEVDSHLSDKTVKMSISTVIAPFSPNSINFPDIKDVNKLNSNTGREHVSSFVEESCISNCREDKICDLKRSSPGDISKLESTQFGKRFRSAKSISTEICESRHFFNCSIKKNVKKKCKSLDSHLDKAGTVTDESTKLTKSLCNILEKSCDTAVSISSKYNKDHEIDTSNSFFKCFSFLKDNVLFITNPSNCSDNDADINSDMNKTKSLISDQDDFLNEELSFEDDSFSQNLAVSQELEIDSSKDFLLNEASSCVMMDESKCLNLQSCSGNFDADCETVEKQNFKNINNDSKNELKVRLPWNRIFSLKKRKKKNAPNSKEIQLGPAKIEIRLNSNDNSGAWKVIKNSSVSLSSESNCSLSSPIGIKVNRLILQRHTAISSDMKESDDLKTTETESVGNKSSLVPPKNAPPEKPDIPNVVIKKNGTKCYKSYFKFTNKPQPVVKLIREKYIDLLAEQLKAKQNTTKITNSKNELRPFSLRSSVQKREKDSKHNQGKITSMSCENLSSLVSSSSSQFEESDKKPRSTSKSRKSSKFSSETQLQMSTRSKGRLNRINSCPTLEKLPSKNSTFEKLTCKSSKSERLVSGNLAIKKFKCQGSTLEKLASSCQSEKKILNENPSLSQPRSQSSTEERSANESLTLEKIADGSLTFEKSADESPTVENLVSGSSNVEKSVMESQTVDKLANKNSILEKLRDESPSVKKLVTHSPASEISTLDNRNSEKLVENSSKAVKWISKSSTVEKLETKSPTSEKLVKESSTVEKSETKSPTPKKLIKESSTVEKSETKSPTPKKLLKESSTVEKLETKSSTPKKLVKESSTVEKLETKSPTPKKLVKESLTVEKITNKNSNYEKNLILDKLTEACLTVELIASEDSNVEENLVFEKLVQGSSIVENIANVSINLEESIVFETPAKESLNVEKLECISPALEKEVTKSPIFEKSVRQNLTSGKLICESQCEVKMKLENEVNESLAPKIAISKIPVSAELVSENSTLDKLAVESSILDKKGVGSSTLDKLKTESSPFTELVIESANLGNLKTESPISEKPSSESTIFEKLASRDEKDHLLDASEPKIFCLKNNQPRNKIVNSLPTEVIPDEATKSLVNNKTDNKSPSEYFNEGTESQNNEALQNSVIIDDSQSFCTNQLSPKTLNENITCDKVTKELEEKSVLDESGSDFCKSSCMSDVMAKKIKRSVSVDSEEKGFYKQFRSNCQICCRLSMKTESSHRTAEESIHCSKCCLVFKSQVEGDIHNSTFHRNQNEIWDCMLCQKIFKSKPSFEFHLKTRVHRLLEITQKRTIHSLFSYFTGKECPHLESVSSEELSSLSSPVYSVLKRTATTKSQPTPLQIALEGESVSCKFVHSNDG